MADVGQPPEVSRTITITAMSRPALLAEMLSSLCRNPLAGWHVFLAIEPGPQQEEIARLGQEMLPQGQLTVIRNAQRLGIRENPGMAIGAAFATGSQFNLCLEEDFLLAPDALALADWYLANERPHWFSLNLLAATCGCKGNLSDPAHPDLLFESRGFSSIGVGLSRRNWDRIAPIWSAPRSVRRKGYRGIYHDGWDHALLAHQLMHPELRTLHPVAARCTHQGATGTYCTEEFQRDAFGHIALAPAPNGTAHGFRVAAITDLPPQVAGHAFAQQDHARRLEELIRLGQTPNPWVVDLVRHIGRRHRERRRAARQ